MTNKLDGLAPPVHQSDIDLRSRVLGKVAALWALHPDLELVELLYEASGISDPDSLFFLQDTELEHGLDARLAVERRRMTGKVS